MNRFPTKAAFRAWLASVPPERRVSPELYNPATCPLAMFVRAAGVADPRVHEWEWYSGTKLQGKLPKWATDFVRGADRWILCEREDATADACLQILKTGHLKDSGR